jgi:hypothetical protein
MNLKNTAILLIFLLAVLGLIIGVHYTEDEKINDTQDNALDSVSEDNDSVITINLKDTKAELKELFT